MDLTTLYMGLKLKNPLVAAASPLTEDLDNFKKMEDAGIAAIIHHSLFEEQIIRDRMELAENLNKGTESYAEALSFFPGGSEFQLGPDEYLDHIRKAKRTVELPVIGSLNCHTADGWVDYAKMIEEAGADALELNIYFLPTDPTIKGEIIEENYVKIINSVKKDLSIPLAVKLHPFFSSVANMADRLDKLGVNGLVLFNRFYQADINLDTLEIVPNLLLSTPYDTRLSLRWIGILYGKVKASLAAASGIHQANDVIKSLMVGADAVMLCSGLLKHGIEHAKVILKDIQDWMDGHEYSSVHQMKGSMSQKSCSNPEAFERANYMKELKSFR